MDEISPQILAALISGLFSFGIILWSIIQHSKGQFLKKKEVLFPLIDEYRENLDKMEYARNLLDGVTIEPKSDWKHEKDYYKSGNLEKILKLSAEDLNNAETGEKAINASFDILLDFYEKVGYLLANKLIDQNGIKYFEHYLKIVTKTSVVCKYIENWDYKLCKDLVDEFKKIHHIDSKKST